MSSPSTSTRPGKPESVAKGAALFALAVIALGTHGWIPPAVRGLLALVAALVIAHPGSSAPRIARATALATTLTAGLFATSAGRVELVPLAAALGSTTAWGGCRSTAVARWAWLCTAIAALGIFVSHGVGRSLSDAMAGATSSVGGLLIPGSSDLGPTYAGTPLLLGLAVAALCSRSQRRGRALVVLGATAVASAVAVELSARALPAFGSADEGLPNRIFGASLPWVATLVVGAGAWLVFRRMAADALDGRRIAAALAVLAGVALGSDPATWRANPNPGSWAIYERGYLSWGRPSDEIFGEYSAGMLGTLPQFLAGLGDRSEFVDSIDEPSLTGRDALIVINQSEPLGDGATQAIDGLLRRGGTVVVVGDHTFLKSDDEGTSELHLNEPLGDWGIRFENDSCDPLTPAWDSSTVTVAASGPPRTSNGNPSGILVGGALHVTWPASALVVGRHGYVDVGVAEERPGGLGWLGDLVWNPGERLGDVCLVAERRVGAGRLVVVGDTTGLTNLGRALRWEWWAALLRGADRGSPVARVASLAALLGLAAAAAAAIRRRVETPWPPTLAAAVLATAAGFTQPGTGDAIGGFEESLAVFDSSLAPYGRRGSWEEDGAAGVLVSSLREGHYAIFASCAREDVLKEADLIYMTAPQRRMTEAAAARLRGRVAEGATLLVACGAEDASRLAALLEPLGAHIEPRALGPLRVTEPRSGGELFFREAWPLRLTGDRWRVLLSVGGGPLVAETELGTGRVLLFGDGEFLKNRCLESRYSVEAANIAWIRGLIGSVEGREVTP